MGDDYPRSRLVSATNLLAGHIFAVIGISVVINREVNSGDGFGQWCYRDWHGFSGGGESVVDV